ncbi:MAG: pantetheine-phosphate adenylyltransferase [Bacteroidales bacterium]
MKTALYPGSFDPFTRGHLDILKSALKVFDKVEIAVGYNYLKKGFLSVDNRIRLIENALEIAILNDENLKDRIVVKSYQGLTVDFCKQENINIIVRGLRFVQDFEAELAVAQGNTIMNSTVQTVFLPAITETSFISSTMVRDVYQNGGDINVLIPKGVKINDYL